jgi:hypothetical protein
MRHYPRDYFDRSDDNKTSLNRNKIDCIWLHR